MSHYLGFEVEVWRRRFYSYYSVSHYLGMHTIGRGGDRSQRRFETILPVAASVRWRRVGNHSVSSEEETLTTSSFSSSEDDILTSDPAKRLPIAASAPHRQTPKRSHSMHLGRGVRKSLSVAGEAARGYPYRKLTDEVDVQSNLTKFMHFRSPTRSSQWSARTTLGKSKPVLISASAPRMEPNVQSDRLI